MDFNKVYVLSNVCTTDRNETGNDMVGLQRKKTAQNMGTEKFNISSFTCNPKLTVSCYTYIFI